jgi:hypothetical protein
MNRLIDTMTDLEITNLVEYLADVNVRVVEAIDALEDLFKPVPHWSDNLDHKKERTWVLCFVSDHSPEETSLGAKWINQVSKGGYIGHGREWKYATPVDLNLRYAKGEDTL